MKNEISLFPKLDDRKAEDYFSISEPIFSYDKDSYEIELIINDDLTPWSLTDENGYWSADEYNLKILWDIECENASMLFGAENMDAIISHDAELGIALQWFSQDSHLRGTIPVGSIENNDSSQAFTCSHIFSKAFIRGKVEFSLILYVKSAGNPTEDEVQFANEPGYIIGQIATRSIVVDGNGSYFSIFEISKPGAPLWRVDYELDDPSLDNFSDSVSICLNKANRNYDYIDRTNKKFDPQLFIEIMSNAMVTIIETVRQYDPDFDCLQETDEGSVAEAINYFRNILKWDISTPIKLSNSVRLFIEDNVKSL